MTEYYAQPAAGNDGFKIYRGDDEDVPFILYTDRTMAARLDITGASIVFTMRWRWDDANYVNQLSTALGTITITNAVNGEFELNFTGLETTISPGLYKYDITIVLAGDTSVVRQDAVDFLHNIT
jgi:hypothetical protein